MDRYIVREPRNESGYPTPHQLMAYQHTGHTNNTMPEPVYYGGEYPMARVGGYPGRFTEAVHASAPYAVGMTVAVPQHPGHMVSGIDPTYLSSYPSANTSYITNGEEVGRGAYQRHNMGERSASFVQQFVPQPQMTSISELTHQEMLSKSKQLQRCPPANETTSRQRVNINEAKPTRQTNAPPPSEAPQNTEQRQVKSRGDKLKSLHKGGPRAFSGSVDNVLKWHRALLDTGLLVIYEIVAKCVSVRPGEGAAVHLVVRDEGGPAMQVLYYQIDFLLPPLAPPCTVRVIGRMVGGSSRLHAFGVRAASGDDVSTLPRRAAVAAHHVAKICREYASA